MVARTKGELSALQSLNLFGTKVANVEPLTLGIMRREHAQREAGDVLSRWLAVMSLQGGKRAAGVASPESAR